MLNIQYYILKFILFHFQKFRFIDNKQNVQYIKSLLFFLKNHSYKYGKYFIHLMINYNIH